MKAGDTVDPATTLAALLDLVFANRSANLTSASAVFTALDPITFQATWLGTDDLIRIKLEARPLPPDFIEL